jgi:hypothetical protein
MAVPPHCLDAFTLLVHRKKLEAVELGNAMMMMMMMMMMTMTTTTRRQRGPHLN